jgi:beta-phosphoglucomutase
VAPLKAVIFDVDGVLVQSMERHYEAYRRVLEKEGLTIEPHEVYANEGRRSREVLQSLVEARGLAYSPERLDEMNLDKQTTFASFGPQPYYPGVPELVDRLHARGLRTAMVTGTARFNVENHFGAFLQRFDVVVTADDVHRTKPDPEPYETALRKLGLRPDEAIVVENAVLGIRSAKAAGMRVIAVASTLPPAELADADVTIDVVADVDKALEALE